MKFMTRLKRYFLALAFAGSAFAQSPSPLPQPAAASYGVEQLNLYPTYDRASYQAKFGVQPPAFDSTKFVKTWFDSSVSCVANLDTQFKTVSSDPNHPAIVPFSVPSCDVAKVNLPGVFALTPYKLNQVQNVQIVASGFQPTVIGPGLQSTMADATFLKNEIGDSSLVISEKTGPQIPQFPQIANYQRIDPSNPVGYFMLGGMNVEQMLIQRYGQGQGIGSPGTWTKIAESAYSWTPGVIGSTGTDGSFKSYAVPARDLYPNEVLGDCSTNPMFPAPCLKRADQSSTIAPTSGSNSDAVLALLKKIAAALGVQ